MMFNHDPPRYYAYLLRCWQEQGSVSTGSAVWRFSLEDPHTAERHGFASFEALMAFLHGKLIDQPRVPSDMAGEVLEQDHAD